MNVVGQHYSLTGELGRGGMAVVHRARDTRHGRDVAIKILIPSIAESIGSERFLREIEIAARLQHPHVVPVFDSGEADGQLFFVMPLIEGESLREMLTREGRLDVDEAVRIMTEVADALDYAHSQSVIHRDLKPENILMSRGHAMLADFGIARAVEAGDRTAFLTETGMILGTPHYMSPELASGETDVGPESDVYALGCILYELLTGFTPFPGDSYPSILRKRLTTDAPRVQTLRPDVPPPLDEAIAGALERESDRRLPTARAFSDALMSGAVGKRTAARAAIGDRSIAVLPFANLSPDPNDAYLADGLAEELISDLSRINTLRVIARSSSAAAHQQTRDRKEVARLLDVRYLLEGSVRRAGDRLRITAQLIDGTTDENLWAEKYGGTMDDVFEMQERISGSIVEGLRARISGENEQPRPAAVTDSETYEIYLRAKHMLGQSLMRLSEATDLLEEVVRRDPSFEPAHCALGTPLLFCAMFNYVEPRAAWEKIQQCADRALAVNPRSGIAHELLGAVAIYRDWNWSGARQLFERARELEPGAGFDRFLYAFFLAFSGDVEGGLQAARDGRALDPLNVMGLLTESVMLAYAGDFEAALPLGSRPIELDPQFPEGYHIRGYIQLGMKNYAAAEESFRQAVELSNRGAWPMAKLGSSLVGLGRPDEARKLLAELERRADSEANMSAPAVATLHLHLGDLESFYRWINRGIDERDPFALSLNREFLWDPARDDPGFQGLLDRVGLTR